MRPELRTVFSVSVNPGRVTAEIKPCTQTQSRESTGRTCSPMQETAVPQHHGTSQLPGGSMGVGATVSTRPQFFYQTLLYLKN